jgi:hypothetical protein
MGKILAFLNGRKTYIASILIALGVIGQFINRGDYSPMALYGLLQNSAIAAALAALRHALAKTNVIPK